MLSVHLPVVLGTVLAAFWILGALGTRTESQDVLMSLGTGNECLHIKRHFGPHARGMLRDRAKLFNGSCYYFDADHKLSHSRAQSWCHILGGFLTILKSKAQRHFVRNELRHTFQTKDLFWIGLKRKDGVYTWDDGTEMVYKGADETTVDGNGTFTCIVVSEGSDHLNEVPCESESVDDKHFFICEYPPLPKIKQFTKQHVGTKHGALRHDQSLKTLHHTKRAPNTNYATATIEDCPKHLPRNEYLQVFHNSCFMFELFDKKDESSAQKTCENLGGFVAIPKNRKENDFLQHQLFSTYNIEERVWMGLRLKHHTHNRTDESKPTFQSFDHQNGSHHSRDLLYCTTMEPSTGNWHKSLCDNKGHSLKNGININHPFVCEFHTNTNKPAHHTKLKEHHTKTISKTTDGKQQLGVPNTESRYGKLSGSTTNTTQTSSLTTKELPRENTSSLSSTPVSDTSSLPSSRVSDTSSLPSSPTSDTSSLPSSPIRDTSSLPSSAISDTSSLPSSPISDTSSLPSSPISDTSSLPSSPISDTSSLPSSPISDTSSLPSSPISDTSSLPSSPISDTSSLPSSPVSETSSLPSSPISDTSSLPSSPISDTSSLPSSPVSETSSLPSSPISDTSSLPSSPASDTSSLPSSPISDTSSLPSSPISDTSSLPSSPIRDKSRLPSSPVSDTSSLPPSPVSDTSSLPSSPISDTSSLPSSPISDTSSLPSSPISDTSSLPSSPISDTSSLPSSPVSDTSSLSSSPVSDTSSLPSSPGSEIGR